MHRPSHNEKFEALHDFWTFLDLIEFHGGTKEFAPVHKEFADFLTTDSNRKLGLMPRGHLKSTLGSVGLVLWKIYKDPNRRIMVGTADKKLSLSFVRELKQYLEDEELQKYVWNSRPHIQGRLIPLMDSAIRQRRREKNYEEMEYTETEDKKVVWRSDALQVIRDRILKEPTVIASSVGTIMTGLHFDEIIFDDIVTFRNSDSSEKCETTMEWVRDIQSVLDPFNKQTKLGDELLVLGTRYAPDDYYGFVLENQEQLGFTVFERNYFQNGKDASEGFLWPSRFDEEYFRRKKIELGPRRFASQYLNVIMSDEERILDKDRIQFIHPDHLVQKGGLVEVHHKNKSKPTLVRPYICIDPAISQKNEADNTAIGVGGVDKDKNLYLFDLKVAKILPTEIVDQTFALIKKWGVKCVTIETVAFQASLIDTFKQNFGRYHVVTLREYKPQGDKLSRITGALEPVFANSMFYCSRYLSQNKELMTEIEFFPRKNVKDDCLDVLTMLCLTAKPVMGEDRMLEKNRPSINRLFGGIRG